MERKEGTKAPKTMTRVRLPPHYLNTEMLYNRSVQERCHSTESRKSRPEFFCFGSNDIALNLYTLNLTNHVRSRDRAAPQQPMIFDRSFFHHVHVIMLPLCDQGIDPTKPQCRGYQRFYIAHAEKSTLPSCKFTLEYNCSVRCYPPYPSRVRVNVVSFHVKTKYFCP